MHCPMRRGLLQAGVPVVVQTKPSCTSTPAAHLRHSCMMGLAMNPFHSTGCTRHRKGGRHTECQRASCQPMSAGQRGTTAWLCHCPPVSRQLLLVATAAVARVGAHRGGEQECGPQAYSNGRGHPGEWGEHQVEADDPDPRDEEQQAEHRNSAQDQRHCLGFAVCPVHDPGLRGPPRQLRWC